MHHKVYINDKQLSSVHELKTSIEDVWYEIDHEIVQDLISSMKTRIYEIIQKHGCTIKF